MGLFDEYLNDNLLSIKTTGRDDTFSDDESYPYEPTPYCVLKRLADSGFVTKEDYLMFYYPSDEYISILMSIPELVFLDEIDCNDLFEEDTDRNRIMIWQIG